MNKSLWTYLNSSALWPVFAILIAVNLWLGIKAGGDNLLTNPTAPYGIASLETAGNLEHARTIIQSWNQRTSDGKGMLRDKALWSLIYDYIFIPCYTIMLALGCFIAAGVIHAKHKKLERFGLVKLGIGLAYVQVLTAALDSVENIALWRMLRDSASNVWPRLALWCAIPKFGLIAISLLYMFFTFIIRLGESHQHRPLRPSQTSSH